METKTSAQQGTEEWPRGKEQTGRSHSSHQEEKPQPILHWPPNAIFPVFLFISTKDKRTKTQKIE